MQLAQTPSFRSIQTEHFHGSTGCRWSQMEILMRPSRSFQVTPSPLMVELLSDRGFSLQDNLSYNCLALWCDIKATKVHEVETVEHKANKSDMIQKQMTKVYKSGNKLTPGMNSSAGNPNVRNRLYIDLFASSRTLGGNPKPLFPSSNHILTLEVSKLNQLHNQEPLLLSCSC